ncbi:hypothetical protein [Gemmatimonas sp.]|uniref:hypothetical protein n=1 Tax=Gemmatimonas sp. TaxID=1962908 RepID=UPI00286E700D|nr:hypothetical protein [Gemmatimonas sp.]
MNDAWIGLLGVLAGVVISSLAEASKSKYAFRREKGWSLIDEERRRLEMIYEAVEEVREAYDRSFRPIFTGLVTGRRPGAGEDGPAVPWARLRMLVNLYRPSLLPQLQQVEKAGPEFGAAIAEAIMDHTGEPQRDDYLVSKMTVASDKLATAVVQMRDAIVEESRALDTAAAKLIGPTQA